MKIFVTGGCGYIGAELVPFLLKKGHKIISADIQYFGNPLKKHKNLKNIKINLKDLKQKHLKGVDIVIHLAAISNDPAALLNAKITWDTNVLNTLHLLTLSKNAKIKKFLFASSGSVYGISKKNKVDENVKLVPVSEYNKTKMIGEILVRNFNKFFKTTILRPGTVCGFSRNLRLDLTLNALTFSALQKKKIFINGGKQIRPQLNIKDMIGVYDFFIRKNYYGTYNIGFENLSINKVGNLVKNKIKNSIILKKPIFDIRSYRLYAGKINKIGFKSKYSSSDAIDELIKEFKNGSFKKKGISYRSSYLSKILKK